MSAFLSCQDSRTPKLTIQVPSTLPNRHRPSSASHLAPPVTLAKQRMQQQQTAPATDSSRRSPTARLLLSGRSRGIPLLGLGLLLLAPLPIHHVHAQMDDEAFTEAFGRQGPKGLNIHHHQQQAPRYPAQGAAFFPPPGGQQGAAPQQAVGVGVGGKPEQPGPYSVKLEKGRQLRWVRWCLLWRVMGGLYRVGRQGVWGRLNPSTRSIQRASDQQVDSPSSNK